MLLTEWNWDDALQVSREEGREEGEEKGIEKDRKWIMSLMEQAKTVDELKRMIETAPPLTGKTDEPPRRRAAGYLVSATLFTRASSVGKFIDCAGLLCKPVYYQIFVNVTNSNRRRGASCACGGVLDPTANKNGGFFLLTVFSLFTILLTR
jgi:hypothetical protein